MSENKNLEKKAEGKANETKTEEMTVFGKVDRKIMEARKTKADKKAKKEEAKAAKKAEKEKASEEKKKFNPVPAIVGGAVVVGGVLGALAMSKLDRANSESDENFIVLDDTEPESEPEAPVEETQGTD